MLCCVFYDGCIVFIHVYIYPYRPGMFNSTGTCAIAWLHIVDEDILHNAGTIELYFTIMNLRGHRVYFYEMYFGAAYIFAWKHWKTILKNIHKNDYTL